MTTNITNKFLLTTIYYTISENETNTYLINKFIF